MTEEKMMAAEKNEIQPGADSLAELRKPFPDAEVSKLPKESRAQIDERKRDRSMGVICSVCGSWHHRNAVHLDYVGHAAVTKRLLDVDPMWHWEPLAFGDDGGPRFDQFGGLWIRLTVAGMTRYGYGDAGAKTGPDAIKEVIGDAIRNAAMRFGVALELWHKGAFDSPADESVAEAEKLSAEQAAWLRDSIAELGRNEQQFAKGFMAESLEDIAASQWGKAKRIIENKKREAGDA